MAIFLYAAAMQDVSPTNEARDEISVVGPANFAATFGYLAAVIFGVMLIPRACPRFSRGTTVLILMPVANAVVAFLALRASKQTLIAQGVRVGWLTCDYSQALDESTPDSASVA